LPLQEPPVDGREHRADERRLDQREDDRGEEPHAEADADEDQCGQRDPGEPPLEQGPGGPDGGPGAEPVEHAGTQGELGEPVQEGGPVEVGDQQRQVDDEPDQQPAASIEEAGERRQGEEQSRAQKTGDEEELQTEDAAERAHAEPPGPPQRELLARVDPGRAAEQGAGGDAGDQEPGQPDDQEDGRDLGKEAGAIGQPLLHPAEVPDRAGRPCGAGLELRVGAASSAAGRSFAGEQSEEPQPEIAAEYPEGPDQQVLVAHRSFNSDTRSPGSRGARASCSDRKTWLWPGKQA